MFPKYWLLCAPTCVWYFYMWMQGHIFRFSLCVDLTLGLRWENKLRLSCDLAGIGFVWTCKALPGYC